MVQLLDNPFQVNSMTPTNTMASYSRRRKWRVCTRALFICVIIGLLGFIGYEIRWNGISQHYSFDPKDVDLVRYFCNRTKSIVAETINADEEKDNRLLESVRAGFFESDYEPDTTIPDDVWNDLPVRGAYYMVVRSESLADAKSVIKSMEDHMVNGTRYPWVLLNNQHFSKDFRTYIQKVTDAPIFFGKIDSHAWMYPHWIDIPRAEYLMRYQERGRVYKGASLSYHQLLRYHSGFFFHHPLLRNVDYTWRVEPGADYSCQMDDDKFLAMKTEKKKLGFVLTMRESYRTIPTLWKRVLEFQNKYPQHVLPSNATIYPWIYDKEEDEYNLCHFWSNFQIADLSFFRSEAYQKYFEYLDKTGNFFYERWGDAPVQTIAAAMFLKKEEIKFFNEIGYTHSVATHCPYNETLLRKCSCDIESNYDFTIDSCTKDLLQLIDPDTVRSMSKFVRDKNIGIPVYE